MVNVTIRKSANYAVGKCQYTTVCSKCHGIAKCGEPCVVWSNKDGNFGTICKTCKEAAEKKIHDAAERRKEREANK